MSGRTHGKAVWLQEVKRVLHVYRSWTIATQTPLDECKKKTNPAGKFEAEDCG